MKKIIYIILIFTIFTNCSNDNNSSSNINYNTMYFPPNGADKWETQ